MKNEMRKRPAAAPTQALPDFSMSELIKAQEAAFDLGVELDLELGRPEKDHLLPKLEKSAEETA